MESKFTKIKSLHAFPIQERIMVVKYLCNQCNYKSLSPVNIKNHKLLSHQVTVNIKHVSEYKCSKCGIEFLTNDSLKEHMIDEHIPCFICGVEYASKQLQDQHFIFSHQNLILLCDECDYPCLTQTKLNIHLETMHNAILFSCISCKFKSTKTENFLTHRAQIHKVIENKCDFCFKNFRSRVDLKTHLSLYQYFSKDE